mmetsp:Transcript_120926/g.210399  ORF Transcript_120926/g.210399 Transcript_120926/m.210399 type:complete len:202 (+) Transcript_120926:322-927(+)
MSCATSRTKPMLGMGTYTWICANWGLYRGKTGSVRRTIGEKGVQGLLRKRAGGRGEKTLKFLPPGCSIPTHSLSYTLPPRSVESQTAQCWRWWGQPVTGQERATGRRGEGKRGYWGFEGVLCMGVRQRAECRAASACLRGAEQCTALAPPGSGRGRGCPLQVWGRAGSGPRRVRATPATLPATTARNRPQTPTPVCSLQRV